MAPVPGTGEYEWTGYIPFDELPFALNPPTHFLAAANNAIVPPDFKHWIMADWAAPYRAQRIGDLLQARKTFSLDDMQAMQADVYSIPLAQLQKHVIAVAPEGPLQTAAMEAVKSWAGTATGADFRVIARAFRDLPRFRWRLNRELRKEKVRQALGKAP